MWFLPRNPASQRGEMRVGRLKQPDGIVGVRSLITVLVQDNMDTVTPFAKFVAGFRRRQGIGWCRASATNEDALLLKHRKTAAVVEQGLKVCGVGVEPRTRPEDSRAGAVRAVMTASRLSVTSSSSKVNLWLCMAWAKPAVGFRQFRRNAAISWRSRAQDPAALRWDMAQSIKVKKLKIMPFFFSRYYASDGVLGWLSGRSAFSG